MNLFECQQVCNLLNSSDSLQDIPAFDGVPREEVVRSLMDFHNPILTNLQPHEIKHILEEISFEPMQGDLLLSEQVDRVTIHRKPRKKVMKHGYTAH